MAMLRVIPRLDIKGPNLVKGVQLEGLRVLGNPATFAKAYYEEGADELIYMDVVASLYGRNSALDIVRQTAQEVFIPMTVGGGLRSLDDIRQALRSGADKVAMNTTAVLDPNFIKQSAKAFGSSTIVVSIEVIARNGVYEAYTNNGRERTGLEPIAWAKKAQELGAGEILLTFVDREGCGTGLDLDFISRLESVLEIPLVVSGGVGKIDHVTKLAGDYRIEGIAIASMFHYDLLARMGDKKSWAKVSPSSISHLKQALCERGLEVRQ